MCGSSGVLVVVPALRAMRCRMARRTGDFTLGPTTVLAHRMSASSPVGRGLRLRCRRSGVGRFLRQVRRLPDGVGCRRVRPSPEQPARRGRHILGAAPWTTPNRKHPTMARARRAHRSTLPARLRGQGRRAPRSATRPPARGCSSRTGPRRCCAGLPAQATDEARFTRAVAAPVAAAAFRQACGALAAAACCAHTHCSAVGVPRGRSRRRAARRGAARRRRCARSGELALHQVAHCAAARRQPCGSRTRMRIRGDP